MNIERWLKQLRTERAKISEVIATVEALERSGFPAPRTGKRGRKFMSAEERLVVSQRMRRYWETRKNDRSDRPVVRRSTRAEQVSR